MIEETFTLGLSKMMGDHEHALTKVKEFIVENEDLKIGHNKLLKDFEQLEIVHKALTSELSALKGSQGTNQSKDISANTCATNPLCVKASLIKENNRFKYQLEKGLVTCIQGEKNLNDLLSNQKRHVGKQGLGFGFSDRKSVV